MNGGYVLPADLEPLRVIPRFLAEKAFNYLNHVESGRWGRISILEMRRTTYESHRLFCIGRSFERAAYESHGKINESYYDGTLSSSKYYRDWATVTDPDGSYAFTMVDDYNHDPFVEGRAFTISIGFEGYEKTIPDPDVAVKVVTGVFRAFGFTVRSSRRYTGPMDFDVVLNYGTNGNNFISFDDGCSDEMRAFILSILRNWADKRGINRTTAEGDDEVYELIRIFKAFELKRDISANREVPTIGYRSLPLLFQ